MTYRSYFLLGETQREQLRHHLVHSLQAWSAKWGLPPSTSPALGSEVVASASTSTEGAWHVLRNGDQVLGWAQTSEAFVATLLAVSAGGDSDEAVAATSLAVELGTKLYIDLLVQMLNDARSGLELEMQEGDAPAHLFMPGGNAVRINLILGTCATEVLIAGAVVARLAAGPARRLRNPTRLIRVPAALSATPVRLRATLDLPGGIAIEDLEDLREGQVIVLDQPPSTAWELRGTDDTLLGRCRPGRVGDHFAVKPLEAARPS